MTRGGKAALAWDTCVKITATTGHADADDESDDPVETGSLELLWACRRLRLGLWFDLLKKTGEAYLEEGGYEGRNLERRPGFEESWAFCRDG
jgi:hypothetical protein